MRVLYIVNGICGSGGLERVLSIKASALAEDYACDVMILSLNEDVARPFFTLSDKIRLQSMEVPCRNPFRYIQAYRAELQRVADAFNPDIICVCDDALKGFLVPMLLRTEASLIYERHAAKQIVLGDRKGFSRILAKLQLRLMDILGRRFDAFVVLTDGNVREWPFSVRVIPNPLPFYPPEPAGLSSKRVIAVGRQAYQKGYDLLLPAWRSVQDRHPDWTLDIYGKKNPHLGLEDLAATLGLSDSIQFLNPVADIDQKFLDASICVLSSRFEGFAMVLIEAMISGVPCVAFDCPHGPGDIIESGVNGVLVPPESIDQLASAICGLMEDPAQRSAMGAAARLDAQQYGPDVIVRRWMNLFRELRV